MADLQVTETEAAELEGAVALDGYGSDDINVIAALSAFRALREQEAALKAKLEQARDDLLAVHAARNAQVFTHQGKVVSRKSNVLSTRTDGKRFKAEHPELFAEYQIVTSSVRLTVSK